MRIHTRHMTSHIFIHISLVFFFVCNLLRMCQQIDLCVWLVWLVCIWCGAWDASSFFSYDRENFFPFSFPLKMSCSLTSLLAWAMIGLNRHRPFSASWPTSYCVACVFESTWYTHAITHKLSPTQSQTHALTHSHAIIHSHTNSLTLPRKLNQLHNFSIALQYKLTHSHTKLHPSSSSLKQSWWSLSVCECICECVTSMEVCMSMWVFAVSVSVSLYEFVWRVCMRGHGCEWVY